MNDRYESWWRTCLSDSQSVNNRHTLHTAPLSPLQSVLRSVAYYKTLLANFRCNSDIRHSEISNYPDSKNTFWVVFKNSNTQFYDKFLFPSPFDFTLFINKPVFRLDTECCLVEIPRWPFNIVKYSTDLMIQLSTYIWYLCKYQFDKLIIWLSCYTIMYCNVLCWTFLAKEHNNNNLKMAKCLFCL